MKTSKLYLSLSLFAIVTFALANCTDEGSSQLDHTPNYRPAKTNAELLTLTQNPSNNMIRSYEDFDAVVATGNSPLSKLSVNRLADFRNGLVFRNNGVASIYYAPVMESLSESDYIAVMALFGLDVHEGFWYGANSATNRNKVEEPIDYKGYFCEKEHSCYESKNHICTSNC